jgi:hypothetical protein
MNVYYVYAYLDPRKPGEYIYGEYKFEYEPFYIGKGKDDRSIYHLKCKGKNKYLNNKIKKMINSNIDPIIVKLHENLEEETSYDIEEMYISSIGKLYENTGPLLNVRDGGRGKIGFSEEAKLKISNSNKGRVMPEEDKAWRREYYKGENNPMYGKTHTPEAREKISSKQKGKKMSDEFKQKCSENSKGHSRHTEDQINKIKYYMTNRIVSDETKEKMSKSRTGIKQSDEARKKLSETRKNKKKRNYSNKGKKVKNHIYDIKIILYNNIIKEFDKIGKAILYLLSIDKELTYSMARTNILTNREYDNIKIICLREETTEKRKLPKREQYILTDDDKELIIDYYVNKHMNANKLHKEVNLIKPISKKIIVNFLKEELKFKSLRDKKDTLQLTDLEKSSIINLYENLNTIKDLNKTLGISVARIKSYLYVYYNTKDLHEIRNKIINNKKQLKNAKFRII